MKKVLVFFPHSLAKRHGGPYSALYHLHEGLKQYDHSVVFLSDLFVFEKSESVLRKSNTLRKIVKKLLPKKWINTIRVSHWFVELKSSVDQRVMAINLSDYGIIHFHETIDLWRYKSLLKNYTGTIILTSHSPKPYHRELIEDVMGLKVREVGYLAIKRLQKVDRYAYIKAGYCVFPTIEASEPYYHLWRDFSKILPRKKIVSLPTGITEPDTLKEKSVVRSNLMIPPNAFVATFVGRQSPVKGFDLLIDLAIKALPKYSNLYFLIIGKNTDTKSVEHERWIETGWTNDPLSYIKCGNLHLVPNRFANFDLNILETLSIGQPILLSETGGNKSLKHYNLGGLFYHQLTDEDYLKAFENCLALSEELPGLGESNKKIYKRNFTAEAYAQRHLELYKKLGDQ